MSIKVILLLICIALVAADDMDFSSKEYQALSANSKLKKIWDKVRENVTPYGWFNALNTARIFFESMNTTFDHQSDVFPRFRDKLIHSVGTVTKARFIAEANTPYTGVFKGCDNLLLRLSAATKPDSKKRTAEEAYNNFKPGFGLKCLRNGMPSANLVGMFSLKGQKSWNFFKNELYSHATGAINPSFIEGRLLKHFETASPWPQQVGMREMATYDENGQQSEPKFPYRLILRPRQEITGLFTENFTANFEDQIMTIGADKHMYDIYANDSPDAEPILIGKIVTVGKSYTSEFGDKWLFFKHGRMDDDFQIHPEWKGHPVDITDPKFKSEFLKRYGFEHP